ncbi:MAG: HAD family hydrolase [Gammaproteobacteria bacterium]|nr:HAD family hydrolase [Gammaproteobacteria bacterium]MCP5137580.1 HAD family hydrolase [Gammaproteobacteria bacterium]
MIKVITFDLDDTLWSVWPVIAAAEQRLHNWLQARYPRITDAHSPESLRMLCRDIARERPEIAHDKTTLRLSALRRVADQHGYSPDLAEPAFDVFYAARNDVEFYPDVLPALRDLATEYTLGALSNGNADVNRCGLGDLFSFHFHAIGVGREKPDPAMFEAALIRTSVQPHEIVHVGDDPHHDVEGALNAGFHAIWVNRTAATWQHAFQPHATVKDLRELRAAIDPL